MATGTMLTNNTPAGVAGERYEKYEVKKRRRNGCADKIGVDLRGHGNESEEGALLI